MRIDEKDEANLEAQNTSSQSSEDKQSESGEANKERNKGEESEEDARRGERRKRRVGEGKSPLFSRNRPHNFGLLNSISAAGAKVMSA
jgi:hypothetical protein